VGRGGHTRCSGDVEIGSAAGVEELYDVQNRKEHEDPEEEVEESLKGQYWVGALAPEKTYIGGGSTYDLA
jgi:hypothetical protein